MAASYMLLVVEEPGDRGVLPAGEGDRRMNAMVQWGQDLTSRGVLQGSNSLRSHDEAVRVKVREGRPRLVDGPFAEAKEMIGGYFLLSCASFEDAVEIARGCPAAGWAEIEVRRIGVCAD